jgi:hypothetical protein
LTRGVIVSLIIAAAVVVAVVAIIRMPGRSFRGRVLPLDDAQRSLRQQLMRDVAVLANDIGERNVTLPDAYARAAAHIEQRFREAGYAPARQSFEADGVMCANIEVEIRGSSAGVVVIGAHYDTVDGSPGADDNASGAAALLALARSTRHDRSNIPRCSTRSFPTERTSSRSHRMSDRSASSVGA